LVEDDKIIFKRLEIFSDKWGNIVLIWKVSKSNQK